MTSRKDKRHGWRNLFITILALALLGVILLGTGAVGIMIEKGELNIDWPDYQFGLKGKYEYSSHRYTADPNIIEQIELEFDDRRVEVVEYEGDEIVLEFFASQYDNVNVKEERNTFIGKMESDRGFFSFNFDLASLFNHVGNEQKTVLLYLPSIYIGDLDIDTSNGDITLGSFDKLGDVELETSNGPVKVDNVTLNRLEIKTSNGKVSLENIFADYLVAKTSNGAIGALSVRAHEMLSLTTSNGAIKADDIDSNDINLKSSNGKITAIITKPQSNFTITCETSNGDSNIESGGSGYKKLNIKTSNADIEVFFNGAQ
ncbi:MAG: DUF4097 family beta strand repeat protein [Clostridia bacterium]|nr:DUF4097 family beta strand repeat protein [Clostridia bacterium]